MTDNTSSTGVRQLCLKLKPVLGSKMDKVYAAYMAEDEKGKDQIEHYLQQLIAKYLPAKLSESGAVLLPPDCKGRSKTAAGGGAE